MTFHYFQQRNLRRWKAGKEQRMTNFEIRCQVVSYNIALFGMIAGVIIAWT